MAITELAGWVKSFARREFVWKSLLLGIIWAVAPLWMFVLAALWAYFLPWFRVQPLLWHFAALLFLSARWDVRGEGGALLSELPFSAAWLFRVGAALVIALFFALLLGIKDIAFVRRSEAEKVLSIALFFFLSLEAFLLAGSWHGMSRFLIFILLALVAARFLRDAAEWRGFALVAAVLLAELGMLLVYLPVASAEKASVFFIVGMGLFEFRRERTDLRALLFYFAGIFLLSALVLGFAKWGI